MPDAATTGMWLTVMLVLRQEADWCLRVNFLRHDHMVCDDFWDKLLVRQSATVFAGIKERRKMKCETGFHANIVIQITLTGLRRKEVTKQTNHYVLGQYNLLCKHEHLASFYIFSSSWFESWQKESKSKLDIELPWPSWSQQDLHVLAEEKARDIPP